jgi:hypothetical protein
VNCDCSCDDEGYRPRVEVCRTVRARKTHECAECWDPIQPGQRYEQWSGIDCDGEAFRHRTCLPCSRIRDHYCPRGCEVGGLAAQIQDCIGWDYREHPPEGGDPFYDGDVKVREVKP